MRVNLATQVLSKTVALALKVEDRPETVATRQFIDFVDDFFDCLNVNNDWIGRKKNKPKLYPYKTILDVRFEWMENTFLKYFNDWKTEVDALPDMKKAEKSKYCVSKQTLDGIRITVHSFIEFTRTILQEDGVKYFLTDKLNQDPIEEHFGKHRGSIGGSDMAEYGNTERKLQVAKDGLIRVLHGNTRGCQSDNITLKPSEEMLVPLPKKKKKE